MIKKGGFLTMGTKRIGLARIQALMENLKREINMNNASFKNLDSVETDVDKEGRYYLEDYFEKLPGVNADIDQVYTVEVARALNRSFEVLGTGGTSALATFDQDYPGATLTTGTTDNNAMIVLPHLDAKMSGWGVSGMWDTQKSVQWACALTTGAAITTTTVWAGLKLTNTPVYATDADQAYFLFCTDDDQGALTTNANLHFIYSIGGTDYITDLDIVVAADTTYKLKIAIDSDRVARCYVNGVQYSVTTATTAGGVTTGKGTVATAALTNNAAFIPYVGVQCMAGVARAIRLHYEKISRVLGAS